LVLKNKKKKESGVLKNGTNIFGTLYDKVGEGWHPLMDTFVDLVQWDTQFNGMPPVEITGVDEKAKSLRIYYIGGNKTTDAYAAFVRSLSDKLCEYCGSNRCGCI
jgi:hypothetical protein